jgi:hypothetical protein
MEIRKITDDNAVVMINHPDPQVTYIIAKFLTKGKQALSNPVHGYTRYSTPQPPPT